MVSKLLVSLIDEPDEDDKADDNEVGECAWVPGEVSFRLIPRNFGQPKATQNWGQTWPSKTNTLTKQRFYFSKHCTQTIMQT
jgi:hypothetical protein